MSISHQSLHECGLTFHIPRRGGTCFLFLDQFIELSRHREKITKWWLRTQARLVEIQPERHPSLALRSDKLPRKYMDSFDPARKRMRKNQRDAAKKRRLQSVSGATAGQ
jgi:hypothetical protein